MLGKKVYHAEIRSQVSDIDLSGQPKGVYFIIIHAGPSMQTEKIVLR
jgi:hypothetical protein